MCDIRHFHLAPKVYESLKHVLGCKECLKAEMEELPECPRCGRAIEVRVSLPVEEPSDPSDPRWHDV